MFELVDTYSQNAVIKVMGIGGGGGNAVEHMLAGSIEGVEFIVANTDAQALSNSSARTVLQLGTEVTKGLGAGANPEIGQQAALEDRERIMSALEGTDMIFLTAGMGGGTGTGAAPVIAQVAKEMGILTVAVVTRPFPFEGRKRAAIAEDGIKELSEHVDSLITIPNEKLLSVLGRDTSLLDAFKAANNVLYSAVQGISELITRPGLINVDFADVSTVMQSMGMAMMGTGYASGEDRAQQAAKEAISSPLLEDIDLSGAQGILVNMTAGLDMTIGEFEEMGAVIEEFASDNATVVVGSVIDPEMSDEVRVTVIATGVSPAVPAMQRAKPTEREARPVEVVKPVAAPPSPAVVEVAKTVPPTQPVQKPAPETTNYADFDRPPLVRHKTAEVVENSAAQEKEADTEYFDIPAFLRRQAD
ncbi:cell division protein FtsZ [Candidatus Venteria ishoeyi]|uniref:Cell division protein FtsZ n=1 Tax=Candidatus Venteria ishoeyi TaxID=1899563 RepID=A0A1H6FA60_9GAMM|nr:cell division protein FtsZ [Candidatus Venteria ishoeyi]MDM8547444.1 cell division protein FtsZ [Candidatus Venteria ishoeyi]SEH06189.1 Cell division protein FtsZ [Candidatus Venteria ishoeyi]